MTDSSTMISRFKRRLIVWRNRLYLTVLDTLLNLSKRLRPTEVSSNKIRLYFRLVSLPFLHLVSHISEFTLHRIVSFLLEVSGVFLSLMSLSKGVQLSWLPWLRSWLHRRQTWCWMTCSCLELLLWSLVSILFVFELLEWHAHFNSLSLVLSSDRLAALLHQMYHWTLAF